MKRLRNDPRGTSVGGHNRQILLVVLAALLLVNAPKLVTLAETNRIEGWEGQGPGTRQGRKEWTVFVYMAADNNLEDMGVSDFNEMEMVGSGQNLNIVVQFDRNPGYDTTNGNWDDTRRFLVEQDYDPAVINSPPVNSSLGELDMTDPETLSDFLEWGLETYPANRYVLVMWDHGSALFRGDEDDEDGNSDADGRGAEAGNATVNGVENGQRQGNNEDGGRDRTRGFCQDWTNGGDMKPWELSSVLRDLSITRGLHFDIIAADVCYFAYFEMAYQYRQYTDYFIGSSDEEPAAGWNYQNALSYISERPFSSTRDVAINIVEKYMESYDTAAQNYITQMALDVAGMEQLIMPAFESFTKTLISTTYHYEAEIRSARSHSDSPRGDYVDLYSFVDLIQGSDDLPLSLTEKATSLRDAMEAAIVEYGTGTKHPNSRGLGIWFPKNFQTNYHRNTYVRKYDFSDTLWDEFLREYDQPTPVSISHDPLMDTEDIDGPHLFEADIKAPDGSVASVILHYSATGDNYSSRELQFVSNAYRLELDVLVNNAHLYYYLELVLNDNTTYTEPLSADPAIPASMHRFWVGLDHIPPVINHFPLEFITNVGSPYTVSVTITDNMGIDVNNTYLKYKINTTSSDAPITRVLMERIDRTFFQADIPPQSPGTDIYYWIESQDVSMQKNRARLPQENYFHSIFVLERKSLLIDNAHGNDLDYTNITQEYLLENFDLSTLSVPLSSDELVGFDIFVSTGPSKNYTDDEFSALEDFLRAGGSLLVAAGADAETTEKILALGDMGWSYSLEVLEGNTTEVNRSLGKFDYVDWVYYDERVFSVSGGDYEVLRSAENETLCAYSNVGRGRLGVITEGILSDGAITKEGNYTSYDNFEFARGLLHLLIDNRDPTAVLEILDTTEKPGIVELDVRYRFSGLGSSDLDGEITNYTWQLNGQNIGFGEQISHTFTKAGRFEMDLHVKDEADTWSHASASFVANIPPTVDFRAALNVSGDLDLANDPVDVVGGESVHFTSLSTDVDGVIERTTWDFGDGTPAVDNKTQTVHEFNKKGVFTVTLTAVDNNGIARSAGVEFNVSNAPPVVIIEVQRRAKEDDSVYFSALSSYDPNLPGSKDFFSSILWDFGDGETQEHSLSNVHHSYEKSGDYNVTLYITDAAPDDPLTGMDVEMVTIYNPAPKAKANYTDKKGATITFTGVESDDNPSDHALLEYTWDFGDGKVAKGMEVTHHYKKDGNYTVVLTVTDDDGANDTDLLLVNITSTSVIGWNIPALIVFIVLFIALIAIWVYPFIKKRRKKGGKRKVVKKDRAEDAKCDVVDEVKDDLTDEANDGGAGNVKDEMIDELEDVAACEVEGDGDNDGGEESGEKVGDVVTEVGTEPERRNGEDGSGGVPVKENAGETMGSGATRKSEKSAIVKKKVARKRVASAEKKSPK